MLFADVERATAVRDDDDDDVDDARKAGEERERVVETRFFDVDASDDGARPRAAGRERARDGPGRRPRRLFRTASGGSGGAPPRRA